MGGPLRHDSVSHIPLKGTPRPPQPGQYTDALCEHSQSEARVPGLRASSLLQRCGVRDCDTLALDIRLAQAPEGAHLRTEITVLAPRTLAYVIGFFQLAQFWNAHHQLFRHIV